MVKFLLNNKANPNIQCNDGFSALIFSATLNNIDYLKLLLKYGADPNLQDKNGMTALMWASRFERDK